MFGIYGMYGNYGICDYAEFIRNEKRLEDKLKRLESFYKVRSNAFKPCKWYSLVYRR